MTKYFAGLSLYLLSLGLAAQNPRLIKPLSEKDKLFLEQKMTYCSSYDPTVNFSFQTTDLYKVTKCDKPCSIKDIHDLEKKLKGNGSDAALYSNMGGFYKRLHKPIEADSCFRKAVELEKVVILNHPDSAAAFFALSLTYMSMGKIQDSKYALKQGLAFNPLDTTANAMLPMLHLFGGEYDSARIVLKEQIQKYGDRFYSYNTYPLCNFYEFCASLAFTQNKNELIASIQDHDIIDLPLIKTYYQQDSTDVHKLLLYHVSKYLNTELRILATISADTTLDINNFHVRLNARDQRELAEAEPFFTACITRKDIENKYYAYKSLGSIAFLREDYKKAVPFMKKTIEAKPLNKSGLLVNASEDYYNLIGVYYLLKDTLSAEKLILEMLKIKPAIDSSAADYIAAGQVYLHRKDYEQAKKMYLTAISLGGDKIDIYLGLSIVSHILKNEKASENYLHKAYIMDNTNWRVYAISGLISLEKEDVDNAYFMLNKSREVEKSLKWIDDEVLKKFIVTN